MGIVPDAVRPPDVDETPLAGELPRDYCRRITGLKLDAMAVGTGEVALCADTTVAVGRRILGKAADRAEAEMFLTLLSGRRHRVITALGVRTADRRWQRDVVTVVSVKRLSRAEMERYLDTGDWRGKAGAYAIQGPAGGFIPWIQGSYTAVMGLPLAEVVTLLQAAGYVQPGPAR